MRRLQLCALGFVCGLLGASTARAVAPAPPIARTWQPIDNSPPAQISAAGETLFDLPFASAGDRAAWEIHGRLRLNGPTLVLDITCNDPAAVRGVTLHLFQASNWIAADATLERTGRQTLRFHSADFPPFLPGSPPPWSRAEKLRLSFWKGAARNTSITLHSIGAQTHSIAVIQGTDNFTAPNEAALAAKTVRRILRLLDQGHLAADLLGDDLEQINLRPYRLLILPYNPRLYPQQLSVLERFVQRRQGRLAIYYQSEPRLAALLGFKNLPYVTQPEPWHTICFIPPAVAGLPESMAHSTAHLLPVRANSSDARNVGRWLDMNNNPDRSLPASAVSPRGFWFSHIPPLPSPSATQWTLALLATVDPAYIPARDRFLAQAAKRNQQAPAILASVPPSPDEIRAAWSRPLSPRTRDETLATAADGGLNLIFEQLGIGGFALYNAEGAIPDAGGRRRSRSDFDRLLFSARTNGIALHAWVICWNLETLPAARVEELRADNRLMLDIHGQPLPWLCPLHPQNRAALVALFTDLARRGVAGIHLDYIRYPGRDACYCPRHRSALESYLNRSIPHWPADVLPGGPLAANFEKFRRDDLTTFVAAAARELRAINSGLRISAAVYPTPAAAAENGQDWPAWLRNDSLDFACPMLYTTDPGRFADWLDQCLAAAPPGKILPGIGTGAEENQLDAYGAAEQIAAIRLRRCPGFVFFPLNSDLYNSLLRALFKAR